jgi:Tfp pilus assembly protein PilF
VLGNVMSELGRSDEAIEAYRQALIRNERDAWSMNNYGLVLIRFGRFDEALAPLSRAVELVPGSPVFRNNLGIALERSGFHGSARDAFAAALAADSSYVKARTSLERVETRLGGQPGDTIDLKVLAEAFIETIHHWRTLDEHEC